MQPPSNFSAEAKAYWKRVYDTSVERYASIRFSGPGYTLEDAALTARIATLTAFPGGRARAACRGLARVPETGQVDFLGDFLGVDVATSDGTVWEHTWAVPDAVKLWWSQALSALVAVPSAKIGACKLPPTENGDLLQRVWTKGGRGARCSRPISFNRVSLPYCYSGISVSYRSDKFDPGGKKTYYTHHFDSPGVKVWMGRTTKNGPAVFIRGGRLRIETHGISG